MIIPTLYVRIIMLSRFWKLTKREVVMVELKGADRFDMGVVKLMKMMDMNDSILQMLEMTIRAQVPQLEAEIPGFPSEVWVNQILLRVGIDSVLYQMAPVYKSYYTNEEIVELIAFYETPLGRKLTKELPQIIQETMVAAQTWGERLMEKVVKDLNSIS